MKFSVYGNIRLGTENRNFVKIVEAQTENAAKEKAFALFGSMNGVQRSKIKIEKVEKTKEAE